MSEYIFLQMTINSDQLGPKLMQEGNSLSLVKRSRSFTYTKTNQVAIHSLLQDRR